MINYFRSAYCYCEKIIEASSSRHVGNMLKLPLSNNYSKIHTKILHAIIFDLDSKSICAIVCCFNKDNSIHKK